MNHQQVNSITSHGKDSKQRSTTRLTPNHHSNIVDAQGPIAPPPPKTPIAYPTQQRWKPVEIQKFHFDFNTPPANVEAECLWNKALGLWRQAFICTRFVDAVKPLMVPKGFSLCNYVKVQSSSKVIRFLLL